MKNNMPSEDGSRGASPVDWDAGTVYGHKVDRKMLTAVKALIDAGIKPSILQWKRPDMKFELGEVVGSRAAKCAIHPRVAGEALVRHATGDWGIIHPTHKAENDLALVEGGRVTSAYATENDVCFMISTNAERTKTSIVTIDELPEGTAQKIQVP